MVTSGNPRSHREKLLQKSIPVWLQYAKRDPGPESIKCRKTTDDNSDAIAPTTTLADTWTQNTSMKYDRWESIVLV